MGLPFTQEQFLRVFADYNRGIWPIQILAVAVCLLFVGLVLLRHTITPSLVFSGLAGLWLLNGIGYHWMYFAEINPAAKGFGALFVVQSLLLAWAGSKLQIGFGIRAGIASFAGWAMLLYAIVAYPLIGSLAGHAYPYSPILGVAPCPTTIFTLGFILAFARPAPRALFVIPILWSFVSMSAAISLGIWEDFGLGVSGLITLGLLLSHRLERQPVAPATPSAV
jgi:hypothetical protein